MTIRIECDLLVVGSGGGGLSAAVTATCHGLNVVVAEKEPVVGGTTAWSGGWMWVPLNPLARRAGIVEDVEAPRTYLRAALGNDFHAARVDAFLENAPRMVAFHEANTALAFEDGNRICDTYGQLAGAGTGGRSAIAAPYDARALRPLVARLWHPIRKTTFLGMTIQARADLGAFLNVTRSPRAFAHVARRFGRHLWDLARHERSLQLRNGLALVGRLLRSAADLGVEIRTDAPAVRLNARDGAVRGAILVGPAGETEVVARRGVVLSTGGFPHDAARRHTTLPAPEQHWSLAAPSATGDGLRLGEAVGGRARSARRTGLLPASVLQCGRRMAGMRPGRLSGAGREDNLRPTEEAPRNQAVSDEYFLISNCNRSPDPRIPCRAPRAGCHP